MCLCKCACVGTIVDIWICVYISARDYERLIVINFFDNVTD